MSIRTKFGPFSGGNRHSLIGRVDRADDGEAQPRETVAQFFRNEDFVFDDESTQLKGNIFSVHRGPPQTPNVLLYQDRTGAPRTIRESDGPADAPT